MEGRFQSGLVSPPPPGGTVASAAAPDEPGAALLRQRRRYSRPRPLAAGLGEVFLGDGADRLRLRGGFGRGRADGPGLCPVELVPAGSGSPSPPGFPYLMLRP